MSTVFWLTVSTTSVLAMGALISELLFRGRIGRQDATWRYTLLVVACLPVLLALRTAAPKVTYRTSWMGSPPSALVEPTVPQPLPTAPAPVSRFVAPPAAGEHRPPRTTFIARDGVEPDSGRQAIEEGGAVVLACVIGAWSGGLLLSSIHLLMAWTSLRRLVGNSQHLDLPAWRLVGQMVAAQVGLAGPLRIRSSEQISSPIAIGIWKPVILLPQQWAARWHDPRDREVHEVLLHEAMHIRRHDPLWNWLLQLVVSVWWCHPLIHYMKWRMSWLREALCDGVVARTLDPEEYAETLLRLATDQQAAAHRLAALAIQPRRVSLESRVRWVLSKPDGRQLRTFRVRVRMSLLICAALLSAAAVSVRFAPAAAKDTSPDPEGTSKHDDPPLPVFGPTVTGVVRLPGGDTAEAAAVYLVGQPDGAYILPTSPLRTVSHDDGRFRFESVPPGRYQVWAETKEFTSLRQKLKGHRLRVAKQTEAEGQPIQLRLHPGCGYDLEIKDAETGQAIPGARISFGWTDIEREYTTDERGIARIRQLSMDEWYFIVRAEGYATEFQKTSKQTLGSVLPLRFDLDVGGVLTGTLRDDAGDPVAAARVTIGPGDTSMSPRYGRLETDAAGRFRLDGLPVGRPLRLYVKKDGYESEFFQCAIGGANVPRSIERVMKRRRYGGDVLVTVLDDAGSPLEGATVLNVGDNSGLKRQVATNQRGLGRLPDLYARYDGYSVIVKARGFIAQRVPVVPGSREDPAEVTVRMTPGKTVVGQIVRPDGRPAAGLRVYYNRGENGNELGGQTKTNHAGRFDIDGLPPRATVTVYTPRGFAPIQGVQIPEGDDDPLKMQLTLQVAGLIRARAIDAETKQPISEFNVKVGFCEIHKAGDPKLGGISSSLINPGVDIQGTTKEYRLGDQLVGAPYKLVVSAEGYETKFVPRVVALPSESAGLLDVPLTRIRQKDYQTIRGRLLDAGGQPIVGASVRLLAGGAIPLPADPAKGRRSMQGWSFYHWDLLRRDNIENRDQCLQLLKSASDGDGRFEFAGVKKETPWLELFYFADGVMSQRFSNLRDWPAKELRDLTLQAPPPAMLTVYVDRQAYAQADSVSLEGEDHINGSNAVSLAYGSERQKLGSSRSSVTFSHLPAGRYAVLIFEKPVRSPDGAGFTLKSVTSEKVTIKAGGLHTMRIK